MKFLLLLTISSLLVITSCSNDQASETPPLQIGLMPTMDSVAIATAYELGLFATHGVSVELVPFSSARDRDAAFLAGAIDGATVDLIAVGLMNEAGVSVRATSTTTTHFSLIAQPEFTTLESLNDRTIMISYNTAIDFIMDEMLNFYNLDNNHIIREEVGNIPTRFEMVRANLADAALISEPFATMAYADGLNLITDTFQVDFNPLVLAFSLETITTRYHDLQAFYAAYQEAVNFLNTQPVEEYLDMIIDLIGFPANVTSYITLPTFLSPHVPNAELVSAAHAWLINKNLINPDTPTCNFTYQITPK